MSSMAMYFESTTIYKQEKKCAAILFRYTCTIIWKKTNESLITTSGSHKELQCKL